MFGLHLRNLTDYFLIPNIKEILYSLLVKQFNKGLIELFLKLGYLESIQISLILFSVGNIAHLNLLLEYSAFFKKCAFE